MIGLGSALARWLGWACVPVPLCRPFPLSVSACSTRRRPVGRFTTRRRACPAAEDFRGAMPGRSRARQPATRTSKVRPLGAKARGRREGARGYEGSGHSGLQDAKDGKGQTRARERGSGSVRLRRRPTDARITRAAGLAGVSHEEYLRARAGQETGWPRKSGLFRGGCASIPRRLCRCAAVLGHVV